MMAQPEHGRLEKIAADGMINMQLSPFNFGSSPFTAAPSSSFSQAGLLGYPSQGLSQADGSQFQMMSAMMSMMMSSVMQMLQNLAGLGQSGPANAMSPLANFGGQEGPGGGSDGLGNFLGQAGQGGAGAGRASAPRPGGKGGRAGGGANSAVSQPSSAAAAAPNASGGGAGVSANLPEGAKGLTFAKAAELVKKGGGEVNPGGKPTVLALRSKPTPTSGYQDTFVVLKPDGTLDKFAGSTRPTSAGKDRAMLKPGAYQITPRWRDGKYNNDAFLVQSKNGSNTVGVGRDANGDGRYSSAEMNSGATSDLIRLHRGNANTTSSTGCLNVQNYDGFLKSVGGRDADFNLVVVNQN
jgi:hypothetical protein